MFKIILCSDIYFYYFLSGMAKIAVYDDGFFNDSSSYISYSVSKILVNEHMFFQDL